MQRIRNIKTDYRAGGKTMESKAQSAQKKREWGMDSFRRSGRRRMRRRERSALMQVVRGVLLAAGTTILAIAAFALILNWWNASDRAVTAINQVVKFVSILLGVSAALSGAEGSGIMRGICVGFLYMALGICCCGLMMGKNPAFPAYLSDLGMGVAAGGLFGLILTGRKNG